MESLRIPFDEMKMVFYNILTRYEFSANKAQDCADVFAANSLDGIYTHGVNRFPRFIQYVQAGVVKPSLSPTLKATVGSMEQWDGNQGPGITNALYITGRVTELAKKNGIGCIGLANTNHWMRGGTYGWKAAKEGFVMICWSNTTGIMPAWGAVDSRLGNNPLVIAVPYQQEAIVLDMAMSQFSYGSMEMAVMQNKRLAVPGGFDDDGNSTTDPAAILHSRRPLPIGYWKGAGLSLLLDILATLFSGGLSTYEVTRTEIESNLSQVFIAVDLTRLPNYPVLQHALGNIIHDYHASLPENQHNSITYPGERVLQTRTENLKNGIPVLEKVWQQILAL